MSKESRAEYIKWLEFNAEQCRMVEEIKETISFKDDMMGLFDFVDPSDNFAERSYNQDDNFLYDY